MSFDSVFYILKDINLLPADNALSWLGRIVSHYNAPHYGSVPNDSAGLDIGKPKESTLLDVERVVEASKGKSYEPQLQGILKYCTSKTNSGKTDFKTAKLRILQLQDHERVFASFQGLCAQDPTIDSTIRGWSKAFGSPLYMVVGIMIWSDPSVKTSRTTDITKSIEITAPVNAAANAATISQIGVPLVPQGVGDVTWKTTNTTTNTVSDNSTHTGDSIFAIEYRIVRRLKHTGFRKFGLDAKIPRFPGQQTYSGSEPSSDSATPLGDTELLTLENADVPWTEALDELTGETEVEVEEVEGSDIGLCFASEN